jgi:hypothetical protein
MRFTGKAFAIVSASLLFFAALMMYHFFPDANTGSDYTRISAIVLVGLASTIFFIAILAITFSVMGVENREQALGLPEGSVRALLAFSLVLIFVCLSAFLFSEVNKPCMNCDKTLDRVNDAQLAELRANFTVAAEQAVDDKGLPLYEKIQDPSNKDNTINDLKHPLFKVIYYPKHNADAADFAKQIFTTLATVFVSVVSFYFGSSVTTSAAAAGVKAGRANSGEVKSVTAALVDSHNAQVTVDQATEELKAAELDLSQAPGDPQKQAAVEAARKVLEEARKDKQAKQARVQKSSAK